MAFMVRDGFRLYYEDTGGVGPTILFLHGAGGNHLSWWQQVPVFAEEYRCVTMDQRGFGQSPDVAGGPGPAALGSDALALLDHLGIARVAMVAQSMGGWAAVSAAVQAPERFWAVVIGREVATERHGHAEGAIDREGVLRAAHLQDLRVAHEQNLHQHVAPRQVGEQPERIVLIHHVHPVADPPRVALLHRGAHVEAQVLRRHQAGR